MNYKDRFDIFVCGGSRHFGQLKSLLPKLLPYGTLHLASITLSRAELSALAGLYDVLHEPRHAADGYLNFNLFCIRDLNRLARAPHFIKIDADATVADDWIAYVEECLAERPDAVLFGIKEGLLKVDVSLTGPLAREKLGREIRVAGATKVIGGFYVGRTEFFRRYDRFMQLTHEFLFCFKDGRRRRPVPRPSDWPEGDELPAGSYALSGHVADLHKIGNEDTLRSLVVHAAGAGERLFVRPSAGRIRVPHGPGTH